MIENNKYTPTKQELMLKVQGESGEYLQEFCSYIESTFSPKVQVDYSGCNAAPGWNFKYKKSSKSICTVYPDEHYATILITMNFDLSEIYSVVCENFSQYFRDLVDRSSGMNNVKWLMIELKERKVLEDIIRLLELKYGIVKLNEK